MNFFYIFRCHGDKCMMMVLFLLMKIIYKRNVNCLNQVEAFRCEYKCLFFMKATSYISMEKALRDFSQHHRFMRFDWSDPWPGYKFKVLLTFLVCHYVSLDSKSTPSPPLLFSKYMWHLICCMSHHLKMSVFLK